MPRPPTGSIGHIRGFSPKALDCLARNLLPDACSIGLRQCPSQGVMHGGMSVLP